MVKKLVLIEFNEVNFELVNSYLQDEANLDRWKNLRSVLKLPRVNTVSETEYEKLEPWIQWASVHSGLTADEHGIFRLGDINSCFHRQIFEIVEDYGAKVGCISAMNADNRLKEPAYFIPDPWTITQTDGSLISEAVYTALNQAVNDNSEGRLTKQTIAKLLLALLIHAQPRNYPLYVRLLSKVIAKRSWNKALFLDLFISDLHQSLHQKRKTDFSTVFFNGFAHLQHHYFYASKFYEGDRVNPKWYIESLADPFEDALDVYDVILGQHLNTFSKFEVLIATGLQQVPYPNDAFYYRLRDHISFLELIGISGAKVYPRMTRDFLVEFDNEQVAKDAELKLNNLRLNGDKLFGEIENRGNSLFVTLTYPREIRTTDTLDPIEGKVIHITDHVVFVAIKNGMHDTNGAIFSSRPDLGFEDLNGQHVKQLFHYIHKHYAAEM